MMGPGELNRRRTRCDRGGFTLIEILIALLILAVGLASILAVFVAGVRAAKDVADESNAALSARAVLSRILVEDEEPDPQADGVRDFLEVLVQAQEAETDWLWLNPQVPKNWERVQDAQGADLSDDHNVWRVADGSVYQWRCRASRLRSAVHDPLADLEGPTGDVGLAERLSPEQRQNPDNQELWRLTIMIYREYRPGKKPLGSFQTYVCTAHL